MKLFIALVLGLLATTAYANDDFSKLKEKERKNAEKFYMLAHDNDWLTGVWGDVIDSASSLYTLIEKTKNGYRASYCYPRYTVTWWTAKIVKESNYVYFYNYDLINEKFIVPKVPSDVYFILNDVKTKLYSKKLNKLNDMELITDAQDISYIASCNFVTGEKYINNMNNNDREKRKITKHYDLFTNSPLIKKYGNIENLQVVKSETVDNNKYILMEITLAWPPASGQCGAAQHEGFYWVMLNSCDTGQWKIYDEWLFVEDNCRTSHRVAIKHSEDSGFIFVSENEIDDKIENVDCYEMPTQGISVKPSKCNQIPIEEK